MLHLHCGWVRTSTTSLQTALFAHRARAAAGIVYPEAWLSSASPTHHGLAEVLEESKRSPDAIEPLASFLEANAERDVLFSAETITYWLQSDERQEVLARFLGEIQKVVPVRCIWTLRRLDEASQSLYLRRIGNGALLDPPAERFARIPDTTWLFTGMLRVEEALGGDAVYVRYDPAGAHNRELLDAFGIEGEARAAVLADLEEGGRLNGSLSHKQAAALVNRDELSAKAGVELDEDAMRRAFHEGAFAFEGDRRCELIDAGQRQAIHEAALEAARNAGFAPYADFFDEAEIAGPASVELGPGVLSAEDLRWLAARFGRG